MQSIKQSRKSHKKLLWGLLALLILAGGAAIFAYTQKIGPFATTTTSDINYAPPTDEQKQAGEDIKKQSIEDSTGNETKPSSTGAQSENSANSSKTVAVEITNAPLAAANGKLTVNTLIQKSNVSGTCTLTLSKSGQASITKTAPAQVSGTVATCAGFKSIDISKLASGTWRATVAYKDASSSGTTSESVAL